MKWATPGSVLAATMAISMVTIYFIWRVTEPLAASEPQTIEIKVSEFKFEPKEVRIRAGEVIFKISNEGLIEHNFVIEGEAAASIPVIAPGKSEELRVTMKSGEYQLVCSLPGHKEAGMVGTLKVEE